MNGSLDRPTGTVKEEICELSFHLERDKLQQKARWPVNNAGTKPALVIANQTTSLERLTQHRGR